MSGDEKYQFFRSSLFCIIAALEENYLQAEILQGYLYIDRHFLIA